jgi:hypothetical protein
MTFDDATAQAGAILDNLADAVTTLRNQQDHMARPALDLVDMVADDVRNATQAIDADPGRAPADIAADLSATARWLAAYRAGQPDLATALTALLDDAAATISNLAY